MSYVLIMKKFFFFCDNMILEQFNLRKLVNFFLTIVFVDEFFPER